MQQNSDRVIDSLFAVFGGLLSDLFSVHYYYVHDLNIDILPDVLLHIRLIADVLIEGSPNVFPVDAISIKFQKMCQLSVTICDKSQYLLQHTLFYTLCKHSFCIYSHLYE